MKKIISILLISLFLISLAACSKEKDVPATENTVEATESLSSETKADAEEETEEETKSEAQQETEFVGEFKEVVNGKVYDPKDENKMKNPTVNFKKLLQTSPPYFVMEVENTNDKAIDCKYKVEFLKDGKVTYTINSLVANNIKPNEKAVFQSNYLIPSDSDEIKETLVYIVENDDKEKKCSVSEVSKDKNNVTFKTDHTDKTNATLTVLFYKNNNIVDIRMDIINAETKNIEFTNVEDFDKYATYISNN